MLFNGVFDIAFIPSNVAAGPVTPVVVKCWKYVVGAECFVVFSFGFSEKAHRVWLCGTGHLTLIFRVIGK